MVGLKVIDSLPSITKGRKYVVLDVSLDDPEEAAENVRTMIHKIIKEKGDSFEDLWICPLKGHIHVEFKHLHVVLDFGEAAEEELRDVVELLSGWLDLKPSLPGELYCEYLARESPFEM